MNEIDLYLKRICCVRENQIYLKIQNSQQCEISLS